MTPRTLLPCVAFVSLASIPAADTVSGRAVAPGGAGVPDVVVVLTNQTTGAVFEPAGNVTGAAGFFSVIVPPGVYEVKLEPPQPPATTFFVLEVPDVVVAGTANLGNLQLGQGVALFGSVTTPGGVPLAGADIDLRNLTTGQSIPLVHDSTNLAGQFAIPSPTGPIELEVDATTTAVPNLVSVSLPFDIAGTTTLPNIQLQSGFTVSGTVVGPGGLPVSNADIDARDATSGEKVHTPKDNTSAAGAFSIVVPPGTYDLDICPVLADQLTAAEILGLGVAANTNVGTTSLDQAVILSGTIRDSLGAPVPGADLDLRIAGTQIDVALCNDNADASGVYAVAVPLGTFDVDFSPPGFDLPLGVDTHASVTFSSATVLDGVLPDCPFHSTYGTGLPGTGGKFPQITSIGGAPRAGNDGWGWRVHNALGAATAVLAFNVAPASIPLFGGTFLVDPSPGFTVVPVALNGVAGVAGDGRANVPLSVTIKSGWAGASLYSQFFVVDFAAPQFLAMTKGLQVTFCP